MGVGKIGAKGANAAAAFVVLLFAAGGALAPPAGAQEAAGRGSEAPPPGRAFTADTVFDEAGVLTDAEEGEVQDAFDRAREASGRPLYAFLLPGTGFEEASADPDELLRREEILRGEVARARVPAGSGAIFVAPEDRWALVSPEVEDPERAYEAMRPDLSEGEWGDALAAAAADVEALASGPGTDAGRGAGASHEDRANSLTTALTYAAALVAVAALAGRVGPALVSEGISGMLERRARKRRLERARREAAERYAAAGARMRELDERDREVSGYLGAQRPVLDAETERRLDEAFAEARAVPFGAELHAAASLLESDPEAALERIERGDELLDGARFALDNVDAEIDGYRLAAGSLEASLAEAAQEVRLAGADEEEAARSGVDTPSSAGTPADDLRAAYAALAPRVSGHRPGHDDPRETLDGVLELAQSARERRDALRAELSAKCEFDPAVGEAEDALRYVEPVPREYRRAFGRSELQWGPAALGSAPSHVDVDAAYGDAARTLERAREAGAEGRYVAARDLLDEHALLCVYVDEAPAKLRVAVADADLKKRAGEDKLRELEERLRLAKAREPRMSGGDRRKLHEYERRFGEASRGFRSSHWPGWLPVLDELDRDHAPADAPADAPSGAAPFAGSEGGGSYDFGGSSSGSSGDGGGFSGGGGE